MKGQNFVQQPVTFVFETTVLTVEFSDVECGGNVEPNSGMLCFHDANLQKRTYRFRIPVGSRHEIKFLDRRLFFHNSANAFLEEQRFMTPADASRKGVQTTLTYSYRFYFVLSPASN
jgi:hypothetical protein